MFAASILDPPVGSLNASSTLMLNSSSEGATPALTPRLKSFLLGPHLPFPSLGPNPQAPCELRDQSLERGEPHQRELTYQLPFRRLTKLAAPLPARPIPSSGG